MINRSLVIASCLLGGGAVVVGLPACSSAYYRTMEAFGKEKRDILASRVKSAQEGQQDAKEQFESALDRFSKLVNAEDSDLRRAYDRSKSDLDRSQDKAKTVHDRIESVEDVGQDLFNEWEAELKQYSRDDLRRQANSQLKDTRRQFDQMLAAMKRAEASMDPVLQTFQDSVLMMKHTLNAQTVAAMRGTVAELERDVRRLIDEMERSIAESERFMQELQKP